MINSPSSGGCIPIICKKKHPFCCNFLNTGSYELIFRVLQALGIYLKNISKNFIFDDEKIVLEIK